MSATDKLVEKNCRLAELGYLADQASMKTRLLVPTATSDNRLGSHSRSLTRLTHATRQLRVAS